MMAVEIKTIGRNGIRFLKFDYYNENLYGLRDRVIIKHSLFDLSQIKVYTTKGKFICIAKRITLTNPLANYIGEPKDVEDLKQKLKQQKMLEKQTARKFIQELKQEKAFLPLLEDEDLFEDNTEKISEIKEVLNSNSNSNSTIFENKYQRYDWLLSQKKISDADKKWMKEYEKTTEYNQIYTESEVKYL